MIIYKITNKINGKVYIGQTIQPLYKRLRSHINAGNTPSVIDKAIIEDGIEKFNVEILDVVSDNNELDKAEEYWIKFYDSTNPDKGYNRSTSKQKGQLRKKVRCVELNRIFENLDEASWDMRIPYNHIVGAINGSRNTGGGYHWEYVR